jgi:hypothetical protein
MSDATNPAPRAEAAPSPDARISWLDCVIKIENEADHHRIWRDELARRLRDETMLAAERDTAQRGLADRARDIAIFEAVARLIEAVRTDDEILNRLVARSRGEAVEADDVQYD